MKNKIIGFFSRINIPMLAFISFTIKIIVTGASLGDAISMISIAGIYAYHKFLHRNDNLWMKVVEKEITDLKNVVQSIKMKHNTRTMYDKDEKEKRYF